MTDRGLFIATMRKPEMRLLRAALKDLKWERGIPWEDIKELDIWPPLFDGDCWFVMTDHYQQICLWPNDQQLNFILVRIHDHECDVCHPKTTQEATA